MIPPGWRCPEDRKPWRITSEGPMPMLVPAVALPAMRLRWPEIWMERMPARLSGLGRAIMPSDFEADPNPEPSKDKT